MSNPNADVELKRATPIRPAEQRALAAAVEIEGDRVLCTTVGRAQAAVELARGRPGGAVCCWFIDQFHRQLAASHVDEMPANLTLLCQADPPQDAVDLAVVPISAHGEGELARDLLQTACQRLRLGGTLVAAVDNPVDRWLHQQLGTWFSKITVRRHDDATAYIARKLITPRKWKEYRCEFAFRDRRHIVRAVSRPGVFSHRRIDAGARQLLAAAEVQPELSVLDIGCGSGVVGLALAARDAEISVHAVDSNARAVACTLEGAAMNELVNVSAELNASGDYGEPKSFDLALANPPYFADFRIARLFLAAAHRSLRAGGRLLAVTKDPDWYAATMDDAWTDVKCSLSNRYHIVTALKR